MAYEMYMGDRLMPLTPSGVTMTVRNQNRTLVQLNEGEINLLKRPGLTDIQFTLLLPNVPYPFARYQNGFQRAEYFLIYFNQLKENRQPFKWILTRAIGQGNKVKLFDSNMQVSLEDYRIVEQAKNGFDIEVEIALKQYRHFASKVITIEEALPSAPMAIEEIRPIISRVAPQQDEEEGAASAGKTCNQRGLNEAQVKALQGYFGQRKSGCFDNALMSACRKKWESAVGTMTGHKAWVCYQGVQRTNYEKNKLNNEAARKDTTKQVDSRNTTLNNKYVYRSS